MKILKLPLYACALLAGAANWAMAENISVRINYSETRTGVSFQAESAERGEFGVSKGLPEHAGGKQWRVVAKNAQGTVLHEVYVRNGLQKHVETFSPRTAAVDRSETVKQTSGSFEVSMPFDPAVSSIEVQAPASTGARSKATAATAPLAKFDRSTLEKVANDSKLARAKSALAAPPAANAAATTLINNGPANNRMDYVFVGDGYTAAEMDKWRADAQLIINGFMADPLFSANRAGMNVHRVDIASNQSGVDEPDKGIYRDTAMDGNFNCYNIERLLCVDEQKTLRIVGSVLAPDQRDVIIVISNSTRYGGSGGSVATLSMNAQSVEVALHEIGHTAFALADEYEYGTCDLSAEPTEGNVSRNGTRSVKWGGLIASTTAVPTSLGHYPNGTVGAFQGAQYCTSGKYRPTENSRMRTLGFPWHAVNEGLVKNVFARYYQPDIGGTQTQTGTLTSGAVAYAPSAAPGYVQTGSGNFNVQLTGPTTADFDLFLYKYAGNAWTKVASSEGSTSNETINYTGTAGYYYVQVKSYSGSGSYTVKYTFPPK